MEKLKKADKSFYGGRSSVNYKINVTKVTIMDPYLIHNTYFEIY